MCKNGFWSRIWTWLNRDVDFVPPGIETRPDSPVRPPTNTGIRHGLPDWPLPSVTDFTGTEIEDADPPEEVLKAVPAEPKHPVIVTLPSPTLDYTDLRDKLPKHKTKRWRRRSPEDILGVCIHQTSGGDDPFATNNYHINPNHISDSGCPRICYTLFVNKKGEIFLCNDFTQVTWSQASKAASHPGDENRHLIGVVFGGKFRGHTVKGGGQPTAAQIAALHNIWNYLRHEYGLENNALFAHSHFGKAACPGYALEGEVDILRTAHTGIDLKTDLDWQIALHVAAYRFTKTSPYGPIDGDWGLKSRKAIVAYQKRERIRVTGVQDPFTELWLVREIINKSDRLKRFYDLIKQHTNSEG